MEIKSVIPTPHITAQKNEIAKVVIMPGDPLRAEYIAKKFLTDVKKVNTVRNMLMFTGKYQGELLTIAGSGMGMPSIGIYSYELFKFYDVDCIIRVGSAGSYQTNINVYDVINVSAAYSESSFAKTAAGDLTTNEAQLVRKDTINSSAKIHQIINETAAELDQNSQNPTAKINLKSGIIHSSDVFYRFSKNAGFSNFMNTNPLLKDCLCVEMESFALFCNAILLKKMAGCLLTISDSVVTGETISAAKRETTFVSMMNLALNSAIKFLKSN